MLKKSIIIGIIACIEPIIEFSLIFDKTCSIPYGRVAKQANIPNFNYTYPELVTIIFLIYVGLNIILLPLLSKLNINNYYIIGAILSIIFSSIFRYYNIPQQMYNIDPNIFQIGSAFFWLLYYGVVINYLVN